MSWKALIPKTLVSGETSRYVEKLVPQLKVKIQPRHRNLRNIEGPLGRVKKIRKTVSALFKYERIELNYNRADEARGYAERLITEAIRNGDTHKKTFEMADFWLDEKQLIHKLFKVLVPRYQNFDESFTQMHPLPFNKEDVHFKDVQCRKRAVLELKGNPFPPIESEFVPRKNLLTNILLQAAKQDMFRNKQQQDN